MNWIRTRVATRDGVAGWLFVAPVLAGLTIFIAIPIVVSFWVSFRTWTGLQPLGQSAFVGLDNYRGLLVEPGIRRFDFATSLRNNFYYVLGVVPVQTAVALLLAVVLNQRFLRGKGFFRTAYYFPSITSTIAVSMIFLFLFQSRGAVNRLLLPLLPADRINWLDNANGVIHNLFGALGISAPQWMLDTEFMGLSLWQWASGPSMTMYALMILATWMATGFFMLIFLAGLQNIPIEIEEAAKIDGATARQQFRHVTLPMLRPTLFFVLTIGVIGTWQVFDTVFVISAGGPQKTTFTPAYLIYRTAFRNFDMGQASAVAFLLFVIIIALTLIQRRILRPEET